MVTLQSLSYCYGCFAHHFGPGVGAGFGCGGRGSGEHGAAVLAVPPLALLVVAVPVRLGRTPDVPCLWEKLNIYSKSCHSDCELLVTYPFVGLTAHLSSYVTPPYVNGKTHFFPFVVAISEIKNSVGYSCKLCSLY